MDSGLVVSSSTAMNMVSVAENNLRRMRDCSTLQYLLRLSEEDRKSILAKIMALPEVVQEISNFYGLSIGYATPQEKLQEDVAQYVQKLTFKDGDVIFVDADAVDALRLSKTLMAPDVRVAIVPIFVPLGKTLSECIEKRETEHV